MPTEPRHPLVEIKDAVSDFVSVQSELAAAELKPAAKAGAVGAGFFAGAALFAFHAVWMLVILIALAVGLLLHALTPLGPWASFTLGFLASVLTSLLIAGVLFTLGRGKFSHVKKPEATIAEAKATLDAVVDAIASRPATTTVAVTVEPTPSDLEKTFGRP
ncbi:MAG: phage holin family protein [Tessaracoccus sp.]|uniref:phage holin family protein n=1 Tax=Tessaracoccus sp. TaxID=1971211 RepID=UPI001EB7D521|nr:phage holin family protein [Tessaracoccus sp.]MBK7822548.1 phage holin family protein [Tessaracoccus sp.]